MSSSIPSELQKHDLSRFIDKAEELQKYQPIIAYWCYYHVLDIVLQGGLHKESPECGAYATGLMDKLEAIKARLPDQDELVDEQEAKRYVLDFANAVLDRANLQIHSNTVTQRTVHALRASYTFFDILNVWTAITPEVAAKIKYAKYHAVRILKAIQAGQDPNLTNPAPPPDADITAAQETTDEEEGEEEDGEKPKARGNGKVEKNQPSVEDDDESDNNRSIRKQQRGAHATIRSASPSPTPPVRPPKSRGPQPPQKSIPITPLIDDMSDCESVPIQSPPAAETNLPKKVPKANKKVKVVEIQEEEEQDEDEDDDEENDEEYDQELISQAQRHGKWAVSALDFNDIRTATKELKTALRILQGLAKP